MSLNKSFIRLRQAAEEPFPTKLYAVVLLNGKIILIGRLLHGESHIDAADIVSLYPFCQQGFITFLEKLLA